MTLSAFDRFRAALGSHDVAARIHAVEIGRDARIDGPFGPRPMLYADYVASGRAVRPVEDFIMGEVLPWYSNSHTEASHCGGVMTRMRREARGIIRALCGAGEETAVIFTGSGATSGLNRLVHLLGIDAAVRRGEVPLVIHGPYEHHSNILPWRESGAEVVEIPEDPAGGPDRAALAAALATGSRRRLVVGSFSAASNVTGILTDVEGISRQLRQAGAKVVWDYAGAGPYLPIRMTPAPDAAIDAIVTSPHKFAGGPAASGILLVRNDAVASTVPTLPGGGTVRFVSPAFHDYSTSVEAREEAGTPNVIGDIRAALCFIVKDAIGQTFIDRRNAALRDRALARWGAEGRLEILGNPGAARLPIFSFRIRDGRGGHIHQQLATRMLSDLYGIQARGGCACAGPYVHRLLGIDSEASGALRAAILSGDEIAKPGFVRLNFSYLFTDAEADRVIDAVADLARNAERHLPRYACDTATAIFTPVADTPGASALRD